MKRAFESVFLEVLRGALLTLGTDVFAYDRAEPVSTLWCLFSAPTLIVKTCEWCVKRLILEMLWEIWVCELQPDKPRRKTQYYATFPHCVNAGLLATILQASVCFKLSSIDISHLLDKALHCHCFLGSLLTDTMSNPKDVLEYFLLSHFGPYYI